MVHFWWSGTHTQMLSIQSRYSFDCLTFECEYELDFVQNLKSCLFSGCKYSKSQRFFSKTDRKIERLSKKTFDLLLKIVMHFVMLPTSIASFATYFITDSGSDSFELPIPMWYFFSSKHFILEKKIILVFLVILSLVERLPFGWDNPLGYLIAIVLQYMFLFYEYVIIACSFGLLFGVFRIEMSGTKEIKRILHSIDHWQSNAQASKNQQNDLKVLFSEYIDAHAAVKQLSINSIFQNPKGSQALIFHIFLFQSRAGFLENLSTHVHVFFHMEPFVDLCCIAGYTNSWVYFYINFQSDFQERSE